MGASASCDTSCSCFLLSSSLSSRTESRSESDGNTNFTCLVLLVKGVNAMGENSIMVNARKCSYSGELISGNVGLSLVSLSLASPRGTLRDRK